MQKISTPDLSDLNPSVPFVSLQFNSYGARDFLHGPIKTVHAPNDNSFVKKILSTEGQGGVLFVDGNKSFEVALLGDMIAENACKNNKLSAYKFKGFWKCMDTIRDKQVLEEAIKKRLKK